ncbi:MAG: hypothetical protein IT359_18350 [Gemmatimonadaceae bacterium]|nr:hypothetical protein [Gemmatimonadaceae bacterium]
MAPQSTKLESASAGSVVLEGKPPSKSPPRVADFEDLEKKTIDVLIDSLKYIATTCGIVIAMYSASLREYVKLPAVATRPLAQTLLFAPVLLWFAAIVCTVLGIYPREYVAFSEAAKERAIRSLREAKRRWLRAALIPFLAGFGVFLYVVAAEIWSLFPFS